MGRDRCRPELFGGVQGIGSDPDLPMTMLIPATAGAGKRNLAFARWAQVRCGPEEAGKCPDFRDPTGFGGASRE
jgi:hypothetical protein